MVGRPDKWRAEDYHWIETSFTPYRKQHTCVWVQYLRIAPLFEIELAAPFQVLFNCTVCHKIVECQRNEVLMHVCKRPGSTDPKNLFYNWHYVEGCVALLCPKCIVTLTNKIFNPKILGCINCRSTEFFNLCFMPVKLDAHGHNCQNRQPYMMNMTSG